MIPKLLSLLVIVPLAALLTWPWLQGRAPGTWLALKAGDAMLCLRQALGWSPLLSNRVVLVGIDEATVRAAPLQKPLALWGREHAQVLSALRRAGVVAVALDILQPFPGADAEERPLARALMELPCALAVDLDESGGLAPANPRLLFAAGEPAAAAGLVRMPRDTDGVLRRISFVHGYRDGNLLTLWFQGARRLLKLSLEEFAAAWQSKSESGLRLGSRQVPLVPAAPGLEPECMLLNWAGPAGTIPHFSYLEVWRHRQDIEWLRRHFSGRLVFLGVTVPDMQDYHLTPMSWLQTPTPPGVGRTWPGSLPGRARAEGDRMAGTEVLAQAVNTLVSGSFLRVPSPLTAWGWTLALTALGGWAGISGGGRLPGLLAALLLAPALALAGLARGGWMLPVAWPLGSILAANGLATGWRYHTTEARRRRLRNLLSRYVSDPVARLVVEHPEQAGLGGRSAEVTLLFSDLNQFTSWSEKAEPGDVVTVLNEYFTAMEEVIFRHGGTLKQFVGDEIMVIFGAPFPQPDAEERAVRTALAMHAELEGLGELWAVRGSPRLQAKFGLHRGRVVVGNVGSPHRTEYAAVGDAVNLASRVMGLCKTLGHPILISQEVYARVESLVEVTAFPLQTVRGREAGVRVYGLDRLKPGSPAWTPQERN